MNNEIVMFFPTDFIAKKCCSEGEHFSSLDFPPRIQKPNVLKNELFQAKFLPKSIVYLVLLL